MRAGYSNRKGRTHAHVEGSPGVEPRLRGLARMIWPLPLAAAGAGYLVRTAWPHPEIPSRLAGWGLMALAVGIFAYVAATRRRLGHFIKGAQGEESVARELALLPSAYQVFHGVRIPAHSPGGGAWADCDHIVVGPRGVAVVETKNWAGPIDLSGGRLRVGGVDPDRPPLQQVKRAAAALRAAFAENALPSVPVFPVLVFASNAFPGAPQGLEGVRICRLDAVRRVLEEPEDPPLPEGVQARAVACVRPWVSRD